jgi:hypothetical protein
MQNRRVEVCPVGPHERLYLRVYFNSSKHRRIAEPPIDLALEHRPADFEAPAPKKNTFIVILALSVSAAGPQTQSFIRPAPSFFASIQMQRSTLLSCTAARCKLLESCNLESLDLQKPGCQSFFSAAV